MLGGKDNFQADREASAGIKKSWPNLPSSMRANRNYMARLAHCLAAEYGMRQFLDIGTGLPTAPNLHEVVQAVAPESRIVYVDNDPIVLVHARALLTSSPEGRTAYIDADLHDPENIITAPALLETLDLTKPVVLCLVAIIQFVTDDGEAQRIINRLMESLAPGSMLALSALTADISPEEVKQGIAAYNARTTAVKARTHAEIEAFFDGLELIEPGVVPVNHWHPDEAARKTPDHHVCMYGGAAIKR